jgi:hypothetical protein
VKTIVTASAAALALAIPSAALATMPSVTKSCGQIEVHHAEPDLGLAKTGTWFLNAFAPSKRQLLRCRAVRAAATAYVDDGAHAGYVVNRVTGFLGMHFYKGTRSKAIGFWIYRPTT